MAKCTLQQLMNFLGSHASDASWDAELNQLKIDSRSVEKNDVFVAIKGSSVDGKAFIFQAVKNGAAAILVETTNSTDDLKIDYLEHETHTIPQVYLFDLSKRLSRIANYFYHSPSKKLSVVGVTGTNGKTTVTQLLAQLTTLLHKKSAVLGTIGNGLYNHLVSSINTTSSAVDIQSLLANFVEQKVDVVAMEISSHGLVMNRVNGLSCAATVFTNLSRDHLDYHQSMENYVQAKWSLFDPNKTNQQINQSGKSIINYDDEYGKQWITKLIQPTVVSVNIDTLADIKNMNLPYVVASKIEYEQQGVLIHIESSWGNAAVESRLLGEFNVSNLLLTLATLLTLGFPFDKVTKLAENLTPICGRMEVLHKQNQPTAIVDYAHTPDALQKALQAVRIHCKGKLWVIFGCGGDRDKGKRPLMGQVAEQYADRIIITNDNPRTENETAIIKDISQGLTRLEKAQIILDRTQAITEALQQANTEDVILIAGKGHEDYQIIGNTKHHYSDQETVKKVLSIGIKG